MITAKECQQRLEGKTWEQVADFINNCAVGVGGTQMADSVSRMVITPEQLKEGWVEFKDGIPNTVRHDFSRPAKRPDGNWEVDEP